MIKTIVYSNIFTSDLRKLMAVWSVLVFSINPVKILRSPLEIAIPAAKIKRAKSRDGIEFFIVVPSEAKISPSLSFSSWVLMEALASRSSIILVTSVSVSETDSETELIIVVSVIKLPFCPVKGGVYQRIQFYYRYILRNCQQIYWAEMKKRLE